MSQQSAAGRCRRRMSEHSVAVLEHEFLDRRSTGCLRVVLPPATSQVHLRSASALCSPSPGQGPPDPTCHHPTSPLAIAPPARDKPSLCSSAHLASSHAVLWLKNSRYPFGHPFLVGIIQKNWVWTIKSQMGMGKFGYGFGYTHTLPNSSYSTRTSLARPGPGLHVANGARSTATPQCTKTTAQV
jgi:hypothetical protein